MKTPYRHEQAPVIPVASHCVGVRQISDREKALYDGIDREIARLKLGAEIGHPALGLRNSVGSWTEQQGRRLGWVVQLFCSP